MMKKNGLQIGKMLNDRKLKVALLSFFDKNGFKTQYKLYSKVAGGV